jgi:hypothetical protein
MVAEKSMVGMMSWTERVRVTRLVAAVRDDSCENPAMPIAAAPLFALLVLAPPEPELPADPDPPPSAESRESSAPVRSWQAELFLDVAYGFNSNFPDNHLFRGMSTNPRTNELSIANVGAFVRHRVNQREPWQFELGFHAGAAVDALTAREPIPGGPDGRFAGAEVFKHIAVANAGFEIRKSKTFMGAGVFESPLGGASFWTRHNWNYTTTWQRNAAPFYLAGAKFVQALPGNLELAAWVVNGFQAYADLNSVPSGMVSLAWNRPPVVVGSPRTGPNGLRIATNVYFGPESVDLYPADWLVYWDTTVWWAFDDHFQMAAVWDLGVDRVGRVGEGDQQLFTGGAVLARGLVLEREHVRMDLALRPELAWDRDGRFFGVKQWLIAGTATASMWLWDHLLLRMEYRYDYSTARGGYFYKDEFGSADAIGLARDQHTVFLSLTAWWDFWFGRRN